ncbi:DUF928 domain-containing protein [Leptolyngbyaceae cyanobacterium UHCC 1019]
MGSYPSVFFAGLGFSLAIAPANVAAIAPVAVSPSFDQSLHAQVTFEPPKGQKAPKRTTGGARRTNPRICQTTRNPFQIAATTPPQPLDQSLIALMPNSSSGSTIADRPTILVYVPKNPAKTAEFIVEDTNLKRVVTMTLDISNAPGIYQLKFAPSDPPLEVGKDYQWAFAIVCDNSLKDPIIYGKLRRIQPDPAFVNQLASATPKDRITLYKNADLWYDALTEMVNLQQTQPSVSTQDAWQQLLQSIGLEALQPAPFRKF